MVFRTIKQDGTNANSQKAELSRELNFKKLFLEKGGYKEIILQAARNRQALVGLFSSQVFYQSCIALKEHDMSLFISNVAKSVKDPKVFSAFEEASESSKWARWALGDLYNKPAVWSKLLLHPFAIGKLWALTTHVPQDKERYRLNLKEDELHYRKPEKPLTLSVVLKNPQAKLIYDAMNEYL